MSPPGATPGPWSAEFITAWMAGDPETASKLEGRILTPDVESCAIAPPFDSGASVRVNGRMVSPIWPTGRVLSACAIDGDSEVRTGRIEVSCFSLKRWMTPFRPPDGVVLRSP